MVVILGFSGSMLTIYIVVCQAHPALVKIDLLLARLFHIDSLLVHIRLVKG